MFGKGYVNQEVKSLISLSPIFIYFVFVRFHLLSVLGKQLIKLTHTTWAQKGSEE